MSRRRGPEGPLYTANLPPHTWHPKTCGPKTCHHKPATLKGRFLFSGFGLYRIDADQLELFQFLRKFGAAGWKFVGAH